MNKATIIPLIIPDKYSPPNYDAFFDFIESSEGDLFLQNCSKGVYSFNSCFEILRKNNALPKDSSKRIWTIILNLFWNSKSPLTKNDPRRYYENKFK